MEPIQMFYVFSFVMITVFFLAVSFFDRKSHPRKGQKMSYFRRGNWSYRNSAYAKMDEEKIVITTRLTGKTFVYRFDDLQELEASNEFSFPLHVNERQFVNQSDRENVLEFGGEWGRLVSEMVVERRLKKRGYEPGRGD
jgi:hypothetical protein